MRSTAESSIAQRIDRENWKEEEKEEVRGERETKAEMGKKEKQEEREILGDIRISAMLERKRVPSRDLV